MNGPKTPPKDIIELSKPDAVPRIFIGNHSDKIDGMIHHIVDDSRTRANMNMVWHISLGFIIEINMHPEPAANNGMRTIGLLLFMILSAM